MKKILIIDDSRSQIVLHSRILERSGFEVISAENAEKGIALARSIHPSLILMDIVMPGMDGFKATRILSRDPDTTHIPVIIVSSKDQDTDRVWAIRQGAKAYLVKPVRADELKMTVDRVLSEREIHIGSAN